MLGDWFDPQGQAGVDTSDLLEELHRQDRDADGLLVGRQTFGEVVPALVELEVAVPRSTPAVR